MKVTQEILPDSQVGLEIEIPPELSQKTYDQVLRKLMRSVNIPGFRKGKVPRQVFLQRVGIVQFKAAVLEELVQDAVDQAIEQESIEAIGTPQLKSPLDELITRYEPGKPLTISAAVDVPPRVSLKAYKGLSVKAEEVKYDPERVQTTLDQYRENLATLVPIEDRSAQMGDVTVIDFLGKVKQDDGEFEEFTGGSAEDFQLELQEGRFIEGFVQGIVGMDLDETKELELTFPEDYPQADLAGKDAVFTVTVKEVKEKELPDLDDEFAQEISEFETLEELQTSLTERYQEEATQATKENKEGALIEALVSNLEAEIPNTLVQREVDFLITQTIMQLSNQGIDVNKLLTREIVENMRERTRPEAVSRLQRTLALGEVAKLEGIEVEDSEIQAKADEMMANVEDPSRIDPQRLLEVVKEDLLQEKIMAWLEENATVELVPEGTLAVEEPEEVEVEDTSEDVAGSAELEADGDAATATVEVEAVVSDDSEE